MNAMRKSRLVLPELICYKRVSSLRVWVVVATVGTTQWLSHFSFFLKKERVRKRIYKTRNLARADVFDCIEAFYNRTRRHKHLNQLSPLEFERKHQTTL